MVVSLALCSASSSDSNDSTDMTGPKISSFTQVMSSVQSPARKEKRKDVGKRENRLSLRATQRRSPTQNARSHVVSTSESGVCWNEGLPSTQHRRSLDMPTLPSSSGQAPVWCGCFYLLLCLTDKGKDFLQVRLADQRPHPCALQQGVSYFNRTGPLHHLLHKLGENLLVDKHSSTVAADLRGAP